MTNAPILLYNLTMTNRDFETDSIPRVRVDQLLDALSVVAYSSDTCTFEQVRQFLRRNSKRKAPPSREAMWTAARDALSDLERLGFLETGPLPRKRSEVDRLRETPCRATKGGKELARLYKQSPGKAFDEMLLAWVNKHPYFRAFTTRLLMSPMFLPDITSIKQLGQSLTFPMTPGMLVDRLAESCISRLEAVDFPAEKVAIFRQLLEERVSHLDNVLAVANLDAKKLVDTIEDNVVLPAILKTEGLNFDAVTLQHLLSCSRDFLSASATSSHPDFSGRVLFSTCDFVPNLAEDPNATVSAVIHHGRSFVINSFASALVNAYKELAGGSQTYIDIYPLRAVVCVNLKIQPLVFALCLEQLIEEGSESGVAIYTELPFSPPPQGENYVEIKNRRIGLLKLSSRKGG